jgi:phosphotriesterase-related protein
VLVSQTVMTVQGPIPADTLGKTAMHEHVLIDLFRVSRLSDFLLNDEEMAADEVRLFKDAGGATIVDVTTPDLGRDPLALRRISEATGVHLVMGCGWYRQPFYPEEIDRTTVDAIASQMIGDITNGVGETGIRAGIIGEIGSDKNYVSAQEERVFRAAARAQKRTGLALTTHTSFSPVGLQQLDILEEEGADLRRVIIGHCDTYLFRDYHEALLRRGAYVQYDSVGSSYIYPDAKRVKLMVELLRQGYASQLLLSCDVCRKSYWHAYGGIGYDYCLSRYLPQLRAAGVSEEEIHLMVVENPRRLLAN